MAIAQVDTRQEGRPSTRKPAFKSPAIVPAPVQLALQDAMRLELVSATEFINLLWIVAQESAGVVDARNGSSSARGLFQLLRAQYELNPHGEKSFGIAIEECRGGIRYIYRRYRSARAARAFWEKHRWY